MTQTGKERRSRSSSDARRSLRRGLRVALRLAAIALFIVLGIGAGIGGVWLRQALHSGELFACKKITVQGLAKVSKKELLDYAGLRLGDGLYAFSRASVEAAMDEHPLIKKARILRRPPHELRIFVVEHQARAYLALDKLYAVDKDGQLFARAEVLAGQDLPVISGVSAHDLQDDAPAPQVLQALQIIKAWADLGFAASQLAELHFDSDLGLSLELTGRLQQVQLGHKRWRQKLGQLKRLRAALKKQGRQPLLVHMGDGRDPSRVVVRLAQAQGHAGKAAKMNSKS